jgi:hypothetical protein
MSGEEQGMRFDVSRKGYNQIRFQEKKRTSQSVSGEADTMRFDVRRGS